jgi:hypothetical protein
VAQLKTKRLKIPLLLPWLAHFRIKPSHRISRIFWFQSTFKDIEECQLSFLNGARVRVAPEVIKN